jgi:predicted metal-dependent phosphoesterase TrpH
MVFIDMHVHSRYSDGTSSIKDLLKMVKKLRTGIAITDHNVITGAVEAYKDKKALVIPGIEVGSSDFRHLLLYFYNTSELKEFYEKEIAPARIKHRFDFYRTKLPLVYLLERIKNYNCLSVAAHPTIPKIKWQEKYLLQVHAMEVINSSVPAKYNAQAFKYSDELKMPKTAGSDSHSIKHLNSAGIITEEENIESIFKAIKKSKTQIAGSSYTPIQNFRHFLIASKSVLKVKK